MIAYGFSHKANKHFPKSWNYLECLGPIFHYTSDSNVLTACLWMFDKKLFVHNKVLIKSDQISFLFSSLCPPKDHAGRLACKGHLLSTEETKHHMPLASKALANLLSQNTGPVSREDTGFTAEHTHLRTLVPHQWPWSAGQSHPPATQAHHAGFNIPALLNAGGAHGLRFTLARERVADYNLKV